MILIPLSQGLFAMIDDDDSERVLQFKWHADVRLRADGSKNTYAIRHFQQTDGGWTKQRLHRFLLGAAHGEHCDHIDGNGLNNTRSNLRVCSQAENNRNLRSRGGSSKFKGVNWYVRKSKWHARIMVDGKYAHIGYFSNENEAARAYDAAALERYGTFARTNAMEGLL